MLKHRISFTEYAAKTQQATWVSRIAHLIQEAAQELAFRLLPILLARRLKGSLHKIEKTDRISMNEFLLLALVIIYLVISYVPISGAPTPTWQSRPNERSSDGNIETDATGAHNPHLGS